MRREKAHPPPSRKDTAPRQLHDWIRIYHWEYGTKEVKNQRSVLPLLKGRKTLETAGGRRPLILFAIGNTGRAHGNGRKDPPLGVVT